ncbi:MAG: InlB B-repeat-containing protein [Eubacteriales bacterium]|nr:InlB B-repeat-containing protein [Eubacteriales bacterium]
MFKKILLSITLALAVMVSCLVCPQNTKVNANTQNITYVAFGDSIAEAYAINMKTKSADEPLITGFDSSYDLVENSYVDLINKELSKTYNTTAYNYAYSGDQCSDLIAYIREFYDDVNETVKDGATANATYPTLTNKQIYNTVKNANIITICIGANNILKEAFDLIGGYLGLNKNPPYELKELEDVLKANILGDSSKNIVGFKAEFDELLTILNKINPNAYIYFTNIYNPYKVLKADSELLSAAKMMGYNYFTQERLDAVAHLADVAIGGGEDSAGNDFTSLNDVISQGVTKANEQNDRFVYVNTKQAYDAKYDATNLPNYNNFVNTRLDEMTPNAILNGGYSIFDVEKIGATYLDPHPTYEGHKLIFNAHNSAVLRVYEKPVEDYKLSIKINNLDVQTNYTLSKGQNLIINANCDNTDYSYTYNFVVKNTENEIVSQKNSNSFTINYSDLAYGGYKLYLTITSELDENIEIVYDGVVTSFTIEEPEKVTITFVSGYDYVVNPVEVYVDTIIQAPTINRENYNLLGWYTDSDFNNKWDFGNKVTANMTLYAKWEKLTYTIRYEYNGGTALGRTFHECEVLKNSKALKPEGSEIPTLDKYELLGWFTSLEATTPYNFDTIVTGDLILYAKWERAYFDVIFNYNGGKVGNDTYLITEFKKDSLITEPSDELIPILEDYELTGWYTESSCTNKWNFAQDKITKETILYAGWRRNVFYVTLNYNGTTYNGNSSRLIKVKENGVLQEPSEKYPQLNRTGFRFMYWYLEDESIPFTFPATITSDIELKIYWKEAITIVIRNVDGIYSWVLLKGATISDLKKDLTPTKAGTVFLGWYQETSLKTEFKDDMVLADNQIVFARWVALTCKDESLLKQAFSPITKLVEWYIDAKSGSHLVWKVNNETISEIDVTGDNGYTWTFAPNSIGDYKISCEVDGVLIEGKTVSIVYSVPQEISISLLRVSNKKFFYFEVDNKQYYNPDKFVWFKTKDSYSDEFIEKIGEGFELTNYKFNNDCKVCVKYLENEDSTDGLTSNIINIKVDNYVDETTLLAIILSAGVVLLVVVGVIVSRSKYKEFF